MRRFRRGFRAISPVLAVLMMIAVAIAGALVVYAWVMGYISWSTEGVGEAIMIQSITNQEADLLVYVQNVGEVVVHFDESDCLYVNGVLVDCIISGVTMSDNLASLETGKTAMLRYVGGAALPGEKVTVKVTTSRGTSAEKSAYPAGSAQAPSVSVSWNRTYGGVWNEEAYSLVATSDGGYAIAGSTRSFGAGSTDAWLVKTDAAGNMEWNRTYGGTGIDDAHSLVVTFDGGYAMAGSTTSYGGGEADVWLVKTDAYGNVEWNRTYGGTLYDSDHAYSLVATSDGGYALAGSTETFGAGHNDFWLIKTDAYGNVEWNRTYGGVLGEGARSLVVTSDGGYAIAGETSGAEGYHAWLVKTDEFGNMEWNRTYGGTDFDRAYSLVATSDGGYALAGYTIFRNASISDFWLVKTDALGGMEWSQTYGRTGSDSAYSLVATSDGGYAIAGVTNSSDTGSDDYWLVKTDWSGNMEWSQTYGGVGNEGARSLVATADGGYAIAGYKQFFGNGSETDFWLIKIN